MSQSAAPEVKPLGDENHHYWLAVAMAKAAGVDLQKAMDDGTLSHEDWAGLVTRCRGSNRGLAAASSASRGDVLTVREVRWQVCARAHVRSGAARHRAALARAALAAGRFPQPECGFGVRFDRMPLDRGKFIGMPVADQQAESVDTWLHCFESNCSFMLVFDAVLPAIDALAA